LLFLSQNGFKKELVDLVTKNISMGATIHAKPFSWKGKVDVLYA
jgi:hypothetical protein